MIYWSDDWYKVPNKEDSVFVISFVFKDVRTDVSIVASIEGVELLNDDVSILFIVLYDINVLEDIVGFELLNDDVSIIFIVLYEIYELELFKVVTSKLFNVLEDIVGFKLFEIVKGIVDRIKEFNIELFEVCEIILELNGFVDFINVGISLCISVDILVSIIVENCLDKIVDSKNDKVEVVEGLIIDEVSVNIVYLISKE